MTGVLRLEDSSRFQFAKRVPADVLAKARDRRMVIALQALKGEPAIEITPSLKPIIKFSLQCRDPDVAKVRAAIAAAYVGQFFEAVRTGPERLSNKNVAALAGDVYRHLVDLLRRSGRREQLDGHESL